MTAAGYIVNDMIDLKADLINKPHKIFIGKGIHKNTSWRMYAVLNVLGLGSCFYVLKTLSFTYDYFAIYAGTIFFLYLYSKYLKRLLFLGNMVIAFLLWNCFGHLFPRYGRPEPDGFYMESV